MASFTTPASMVKRVIAFGIDVAIGAALVLALLFFQESFRTRMAFDKSKHTELSDTGIPQWFRYALDSYKEKELEPGLFIRGIEEEKNIAFPVILLAPWLIFTLSFLVLGASPGKKLLGLRVNMASGGKISAGKASVRYFGKWLSAIPAFLGYFMAFTNPQRQTLHDKMNGTVVVNA